MATPASADMVKVPTRLMGAGAVGDRYMIAALIALPYLGLKPGCGVNVGRPQYGLVRVRLVPTDGRMIGDDCEQFRSGHPFAGGLRHLWFDRGDGVMLGYLKPEAVIPGVNDKGELVGIDTPDPSGLAEQIRKAAEDHPFLASKIA